MTAATYATQGNRGRIKTTTLIQNYAQFLYWLRTQFADGQAHALKTTEVMKRYHISLRTFSYLKDRGILERDNETGFWRRKGNALNELTAEKLQHCVGLYIQSKSKVPDPKEARQAANTTPNLAELKKQGLGMAEVAQLMKMPTQKGYEANGQVYSFGENTLPTEILTETDATPKTDWDLPQEESVPAIDFNKLPLIPGGVVGKFRGKYIPVEDEDSTESKPINGFRTAGVVYREDSDELAIRIEVSGFFNFDLSHIQKQVRLSAERILELIEGDLWARENQSGDGSGK